MKSKEELATEWLRANDWDYQKYGDRRGDRSAYDGLMNYEISQELETAYLAGFDAGFQRAVEMLREATPLSVTGEVAPPGATTYNTGVGWASWLEKQSSPPPH